LTSFIFLFSGMASPNWSQHSWNYKHYWWNNPSYGWTPFWSYSYNYFWCWKKGLL